MARKRKALLKKKKLFNNKIYIGDIASYNKIEITKLAEKRTPKFKFS